MPINRDDGRHDCSPHSEQSPFACTCGKVWELDGNVWEQPEHRAAREEALAAVALLPSLPVEGEGV